jgi:hypothetical protein
VAGVANGSLKPTMTLAQAEARSSSARRRVAFAGSGDESMATGGSEVAVPHQVAAYDAALAPYEDARCDGEEAQIEAETAAGGAGGSEAPPR